jgi:hypothetical protein
MTEADLNKAIEIAEEAVAGFADDDSFEQLLALAVIELRDRLNNLKENVKINQSNLLQRLNHGK